MNLPDVAGNIRAELARQRKTRESLRESLRISRGSMHRRLAGHTSFTTDELVLVAKFLDVPIAELFRSDAAEVSA
ncbi:helix-turn-helix domain-containing protein [[Mycobacterium] crassicus]|uniref:Helix-turn-helix transcriptional regulator n=1 Tax=[Mycobacterium] crassicus TaxID=2872309 RepID=A0ABU5XL51_9MYCO|nr:helix-turn-helix transcriptional regulator [Mycolicibacter sp. MYC098]MEB3022903.1 helix-turn-helix transcriptional regulator [Mycolicibacter sp. MYC098]